LQNGAASAKFLPVAATASTSSEKYPGSQKMSAGPSVDTAVAEQLAKVAEHLGKVDEAAIVVLKGHLLIEEALTEIIETFVFRSEHLKDVRMECATKIKLARSMSLDENNNSMWALICAINALRNSLAHSLQSELRAKRSHAVLRLYKQEVSNVFGPEAEQPECLMLTHAVALSLGFLSGHINEVRRFRGFFEAIDPVVNPHRLA
jgi:hypothetical protein